MKCTRTIKTLFLGSQRQNEKQSKSGVFCSEPNLSRLSGKLKSSKHLTFLIFGSLVILNACGGADTTGNAESGYESPSTQPLENQTTNDSTANQTIHDRMLIKTADLSFRTNDVDSTRAGILKSAQHYGSYIASDNSSKSNYRYSTTISIRVPNQNFEPLLYEISEGVEAFDIKDIRADDVTEEFVDVQARVKTKKEMELRYHELFKEAKTIPEMIEIEQQIGILRSEIESIEGRLKYLSNQVSYSTINVTFYEEYEQEEGWGDKFSDSFSQGWNGLVLFFVGLTAIWPFLVILMIGGFFLRRYLKKIKLTREKKKQS